MVYSVQEVGLPYHHTGLLALTRVGSRRVIQISAAFMLFFSIFGKFGALLPFPSLLLELCIASFLALMSSAGLGLLQYCNLNSFRTKFIIGFSFFMGLSLPTYFSDYVITMGSGLVHTHSVWFDKMVLVVSTSPATVGGIVAYSLDLTLACKHESSHRDNGRHWWAKFKDFDKDPRSVEFYSLPYGLSKYFPSH